MRSIHDARLLREFTAEVVNEKVIRVLIEAAVQAPSAVNAQPCTFLRRSRQNGARHHLGGR